MSLSLPLLYQNKCHRRFCCDDAGRVGGPPASFRCRGAGDRVTLCSLCFLVKLRITCVQLCERIDSTLEIRHGAHAAFHVVSNTRISRCSRNREPRSFFLHLTRLSSASAAIAMHMLCPSFKLCTRYVPRNRQNMTHAPLNRHPCKFKFAHMTFCRNASTSMPSARTRRYSETLSLESANVVFIPPSDCCLHSKILLLACPVARYCLSVFFVYGSDPF